MISLGKPVYYLQTYPTEVLRQNSLILWLHLPISPVKVLNSYLEAVACLAQKSRMGVNPPKLLPNHLWQMNVIHIAEFGKLRYVHVTIDTFSGFLMVTVQTGESTTHVTTHCLKCFSYMEIPKIIKTDNGTRYVSKTFQQFCSQCSPNIRQVFLIILKGKELWNVPIAS